MNCLRSNYPKVQGETLFFLLLIEPYSFKTTKLIPFLLISSKSRKHQPYLTKRPFVIFSLYSSIFSTHPYSSSASFLGSPSFGKKFFYNPVSFFLLFLFNVNQCTKILFHNAFSAFGLRMP